MSMEWGAQNRRGLMASLAAARRTAGAVALHRLFKVMSAATGPDFERWGWRVPFLASIVLVGIGLYVRLRVMESPSFTALKRDDAVVRRPVVEVIKRQPREILTSAFVRLSEQAPFYLFITFVLTYGTEKLSLARDSLLNATLSLRLSVWSACRSSATSPTSSAVA